MELKKLATEDGRREYYKYDLANPATLVHHQEPYLDPRFNKELHERYGEDKHGDPRVRIVWAGNLRQPKWRQYNGDTIEYSGMKYAYMRIRKDIGCEYLENGKKVFVTSVDKVPEGAVFSIVPHWDDLGVMKFVIEMKFTAQELTQMGWYPELDKDDRYTRKGGNQWRLDPNPNGEYIFVHYIETPEGDYKDVAQEDLDAIHFMVHRSLNETEEEFIARRTAEMEQMQQLMSAEEAKKLEDLIADERIKAEKKLAKGKIIYGGV